MPSETKCPQLPKVAIPWGHSAGTATLETLIVSAAAVRNDHST